MVCSANESWLDKKADPQRVHTVALLLHATVEGLLAEGQGAMISKDGPKAVKLLQMGVSASMKVTTNNDIASTLGVDERAVLCGSCYGSAMARASIT